MDLLLELNTQFEIQFVVDGVCVAAIILAPARVEGGPAQTPAGVPPRDSRGPTAHLVHITCSPQMCCGSSRVAARVASRDPCTPSAHMGPAEL